MKNMIIILFVLTLNCLTTFVAKAQDFWQLLSAVSGGIYSLAISPNGYLFVGTNRYGVYRSTNDGVSWTQINVGIKNDEWVRSFAINTNGHIFAGTAYFSRIYRSVQPTTVVEEITGDIRTLFSLEQNYPNPFNPSTTIQFTLPGSNYVTLKVYNTLGEDVATLVQGKFSAGKYKVEWNTNGLASGIYFYHLQAGGFVATKESILLR